MEHLIGIAFIVIMILTALMIESGEGVEFKMIDKIIESLYK